MEDLRKLRACMVCGAVRSFDQFREAGCPNCEAFLQLGDSPDRILDCTTSSFSGYHAFIPAISAAVACQLTLLVTHECTDWWVL